MNLPSTNSDSDNNSEHNNNERPPATIIPFVEASDSGPSFTFDRRSCWVLGGLPYPGLGVVGWEVYGCPGWPTVSRPQVPTPACYSCHIPPLAEWPSLPLTDDIPHIRDFMIPPRLPAGRSIPLQPPHTASSRVDPSETILLSPLSGHYVTTGVSTLWEGV